MFFNSMAKSLGKTVAFELGVQERRKASPGPGVGPGGDPGGKTP